MIIQFLKSIHSWLREKAAAALAWLKQHGPVAQDNAKQFLTSPLSEAEYALLKRISAIVGTALALYLVATSGLLTAIMVPGLCIGLALMLHKFAWDKSSEGQPRLQSA